MPRAMVTGSARPDATEVNPDWYLRERYVRSGAEGASPALRAYYAAKPVLPRRLQIALRRAYAPRQARRAFPSWPIEPLLVDRRETQIRERLRASAGEPVPLLAEWPDARRFAAILTHDVEGPAGVDNVMRVIDVERRYGLVSSWNFVAEWYPIPAGLFDQVREAGCEIGLHAIKHDGLLFRDRETFESNLPAIHRYLEAWGAVGFRSPATHRNPDWMPELRCLYDSSFPDTDPFEPQPGGCCSIFPFLLDDLVELPITLVQDHTLWEILRQPSIEMWRRKTEWLISKRGLVNVIVHPDYVVRDDRLALYEEFCAYLRGRLDEAGGWHALPRDVASWWKVRERIGVEITPEGPRVAGDDAPAGARVVFAREDASGALVFDG